MYLAHVLPKGLEQADIDLESHVVPVYNLSIYLGSEWSPKKLKPPFFLRWQFLIFCLWVSKGQMIGLDYVLL